MAYHKLHSRTEFQGLSISIENPKGGKRHWTDEETGEQGFTVMEYPYGYIRGTLGTDGDEVDVFLGPNKSSDKVFVVTQNKKPEEGYTGSQPWLETDEQKVMLGFDSPKEAQDAYLRHFDDPRFFGRMIELTMSDFKERLSLKHGKLIKGLNPRHQPAIITEDNIRMLVLSELNKAFQPQTLKPGGEVTNKARMVDTESEEDAEKSTRAEAIAELEKACRALAEEEMDLKKKTDKEEDTEKSVNTGVSENIHKALRAIAVSHMTRRQRMDAAYQLGVARGRQAPRSDTEPAKLTNLNVGTARTRPTHEPPVVPVRRVEVPQPKMRPGADLEACTMHGYVHKSDSKCPICEGAKVNEAKPLWRR